MEVNRFKIEGKFGIELSTFSIIPEDVKGVICIFHGMGEHKERYLNFAKWMAKQGYAVFAHDHRKHGESIMDFDKVGIFTSADQWEYVIDDAHYVVREARKQVPEKPMIVLGHSMGSIIARRYISKYTAIPSAAIIMGTLPIQTKGSAFLPLTLAKIINIFKKGQPSPFIANMLNNKINKQVENPRTDFDWLSRDEKQVDKYIEDPLCGFAYSPQFYIEFFKALVKVNQSEIISETRDIPVLFISGKEDPVGDFGHGVNDVVEMLSGHGMFQLTNKLIVDNRHEVLNELKKTNNYKIIKEWCDSVI